MPGPRGRGDDVGRGAMTLVCVALSAGLLAGAASAQETMEILPPEALPRAVVAAPTLPQTRQSAVPGTAPEILDLARLNLIENRTGSAQRLLEQLVARFPDSPEAQQARAELLALYVRDARIASPTPPTARATASPTLSSPQPANAWRTSLILAPTLQDELRDTIGDRVFFSAASMELGARAKSVIAAQARWLVEHPELDAIVEGHADDADAGADDRELSRRRAEAMLSQLVLEGVEPSRLRLNELGSDARVATCGDSDCAAQNRRAVLRVGARAPVVMEAAASAAPQPPMASPAPAQAGTRR